MSQYRPSGIPEPQMTGSPRPAAAAAGGAMGVVVTFGVAGALIAIGGLLPRAQLVIGPLIVQTEGIAIGLVIIGGLMVLRAVQLGSRGGAARGAAAVLFAGPVVALGLVVYAFATAKSDLANWAETTGANQVASRAGGVSAAAVSARISQLVNSGQAQLTIKPGLYIALIGSLLGLGAAIAALFVGSGAGRSRGPAPAPAGNGWAAPAGAPAPAAPASTPPPGPPPTDWTAPPADWTPPPPPGTPPDPAPASPPPAPAPEPPAQPPDPGLPPPPPLGS